MVTVKRSVCIALTCLLVLIGASCGQQGAGTTDNIPTTDNTSAEAAGHTEPCETETKMETVACNHERGEWIIDKKPAVGIEGSKHTECTMCGLTLQTETIPALACSEGLEFISNGDGTCYLNEKGACRDKDVVIPSTSPEGDIVTDIGRDAFYGCTLTSVVIPDTVTYIGVGAFRECADLTSVVLPDSVTYIGSNAFYGCSKLLEKENGVYYIDDWVVDCDTSVSEIIWREGIVGIAGNAFEDCVNLTSVMTPDGVICIGFAAFYDCTSLTSVMIPDSVAIIGAQAFMDCTSLTSITIPDGVTILEPHTFWGCSSLTSMVIPDSVTVIGNDTFRNCDGLTDVYYTGTKKEWNAIIKGIDWDAYTGPYTIHYNYTP